MSKQVHLDIVTPNANLYSGLVDMVIVRTTEGDIGVLYNHEATVAPLSIGTIKIKNDEDYRVATCNGGFVDIGSNRVTVITDSAEWATDIDVARAEQSKKRADERITSSDQKVNMDRARVSLLRAINRIRVAETYGAKKDA